MSSLDDQIDANVPDELLATSLPARIGPYRSLSDRRYRDPSHRKNVSFNDVPIVHEVPSHDTVRNSSWDTNRSWTCIESTPSISVVSPFSSSSISTTQKPCPNRPSNTSINRLSDWPIRTKSLKITEEITEHNSSWNPPLIVVHTPDERTGANSPIAQSINSENYEEKKYPYRSAVTRNTEPCRSLPFTYVPVSESSTTYASMLSTNQPSNEQYSTGHIHATRIRSATLPITVTHSSTRNNTDMNSTTPFRPSTSSSRTVLRPATIAFQCTQLTTTNNTSLTNLSFPKSSTVHTRLSSAAPYSRLLLSSNRPLSSAIKHPLTHPITDAIIRSHPPTFPRSRSANILTTRRNTTSPIPMLNGQSTGNTSLFASAKRNSSVRQTYSSYYTNPILLPADIN